MTPDDPSPPTTDLTHIADMTVEELREAMDLARGLRGPRREQATEDLVAMGPRAVRLAARTIEEVAADDWATDDDIDRQGEAAAAVVRGVGRAAAPVLDELATDGVADVCVNDWAQELLFEVLGLEGDARRGACHHGAIVRDGSGAWECAFCGAGFGDRQRPTEGPAPRAPGKGARARGT